MAKKTRKKSAAKSKKKKSVGARKKRKTVVRKKPKVVARKKVARKAKRKGVIGTIVADVKAVVDTLADAERLHRRMEPHVSRDPE
jgi:hypothetical protein